MKRIKSYLTLSLVAFSALGMSGCKKKKGGASETATYAFSIGLSSRANAIEVGESDQKVEVYDNGVDTANRSYSFISTDENVATIDQEGNITAIAPGRVNFIVTEANSGMEKALKRSIVVNEHVEKAKGGYNYSGGTKTEDLNRRAEVLGQLEKYAMDTHLTGLTLFENGGLVKYSERVQIPTAGKAYIDGYGFGILSDGTLEGTLPGDEGSSKKPTYYHSSISQDSLKINQYTATGSQVSDLASYITSSYWSTKLNDIATAYEWFPCLATDEIYRPEFDETGHATYSELKSKNNEPVPHEPLNSAGLYKKWRIYVKTDGVNGESLKYTTASGTLQSRGFNNRGVTIDDYEFIYQFLFTGSNNITRGTEMANDTSYGVKGAQRFFNETKSVTDGDKIQKLWDEYVKSDKIGIHKGSDANGDYLDIELINAIDSFTAMYTLSGNLTSPLPRDFFVGSKAIASTMKQAAKIYGTFNNGDNDKILDYTLCLGAYTLSKWTKNQEIIFDRNDAWFEHTRLNRYKIPGVYLRVIDTSTDTEATWKQFEISGNLDSAGVPSSKVQEYRGTPNVYSTKGDATFKLNINSCTQAEWDKMFGPNGTIAPNGEWNVKPWMSNSDFLDGLFYSIDREAFATKRGVAPSTNYFSNAYQNRNATSGTSYNETQAHKDAVSGYSEDNGYNLDKAIDCFRNAVKELQADDQLTLGSKENPTVINIHIRWMYQSDVKEYGEDIKFYFEKAFNDISVCGGRVQLEVQQDAVKDWEQVYNEWMMKGQFDLAFGAISGNTYNPLNFMEVLKSDNSSGFTLNWGPDTSKVDENNPIIYDGQMWSFDALWEVADHGGIVEEGNKIKPVKYCYANRPTAFDPISPGEEDRNISFSLGENGEPGHDDGNEATEYSEDSAGVLLDIKNGVKLNKDAKDALGNGALKLGDTAGGSFEISVPDCVSKVKLYASNYKSQSGLEVTVNDGEPVDVATTSNEGEYEVIEVSTLSNKKVAVSVNKEAMFDKIDFEISEIDTSAYESDLYKGCVIEFPVSFAEFDEGEGDTGKAIFGINRMDIYVFGRGNITMADKDDPAHLIYDRENGVVRVILTEAKAQEINNAIKVQNGFDTKTWTGSEAWKNNPFTLDQLGKLFDYELYYELTIMGGSTSINYYAVEKQG